MTYEGILFEQRDGVAVITLNRPEKLNALSNRMIFEMLDAIERVSRDEGARVLAVRGAGRAFCAGDDLSGMGDFPHPIPPGSSFYDEYQHKLLRALRGLRRPTIASLHGFCLGMGNDMAMACDLRIAAEGTKIGEPRILRGMHISTGSTYLLPRMVGLPRALGMLMLGEFLDAKEAHHLGFVHRLVPPEQLESATLELAGQLARGPTRAYAVLKAQIYREYDMDFDQSLRDMLYYRYMERIEDREEGVKAFLEKREPRYTGR